MTIEVKIVGANGKPLQINGENEASVVVHSHPPKDEKVNVIPISESFVDTAGSSDMVVNGAVTPVEFSVSAINGARTISLRDD